MSKIEILKNRIDTSLTKLNDVLNDYEKIAIKKNKLTQKINSLKSEHLNDLNELNSLMAEVDNLVKEREND
jgi:archaellum component FlaC